MQIVAALFVENIDQRTVAGPATRLDLGGVMFSMAAPAPFPVTVSPHLVVLVRCAAGETGTDVLEVIFRDGSGEQVARNVQPLQVEPGKFGRQLVKGDLTYPAAGTIEAHCRTAKGDTVVVPLTLLPPVG
ncbi:MAG: hypothetical protein NVSMB12_16890 [Acidimicrobiales bacterium]